MLVGEGRVVAHNVQLVGGSDLDERLKGFPVGPGPQPGEAVVEVDVGLVQLRVHLVPVAAGVELDELLGMHPDGLAEGAPLIAVEQAHREPIGAVGGVAEACELDLA